MGMTGSLMEKKYCMKKMQAPARLLQIDVLTAGI